MILRAWLTAAAEHWNGLVKNRVFSGGDLYVRPPVGSAAAVFAVDVSGSPRRVLFDGPSSGGSTDSVKPGLRIIQDELDTLAETQRLLAILAATAAREGAVQGYSWVHLAEQARLLASRAERASAALAGVQESVADKVHSKRAGEKS